MENINFIEWDEKHQQCLIRLAGDAKSQETRLAKMKAAEDMYEALERMVDGNIIENGRIVERCTPTPGAIHAAYEALAKAEVK